MAKHTPGPWKVADYRTLNSGDYVIRGPEKGPDNPNPVVASVVKQSGAAANARLIAAAPDLLEALIRLSEAWEKFGPTLATVSGGPTSLDLAHAAIAKAIGKD